VSHPCLDAARTLGPTIRAHADESERQRRLTDALVAALRPTGLLRMALPAAFGGPEVDPLTLVDAIEELSFHDGATGWCVMISATTASLAASLSAEAAHEIFGNPLDAYAGTFAPTATGRATTGGWMVDGRWMWGSGASHAAWITGGTTTDDAGHCLLFFPAADVSLHDTWYSSGLRGTASGDFSVTSAFVPRHRAVRVDAAKHFPNYTLLAMGTAATTLGMARRAVDELVTLASVKTPAFAARTLANHPPAQLHVAQADAKTRAARAFLRDSIAEAWALAGRGAAVPVALRARVRLACTHAASEAAAAVDLCYASGGGSAVLAESPLQRCFRDVHTATQHIMLSDRNLLTAGRLAFGLETDTSML
jgi:alkylation response protein AidB-like acyl-CoA dehydrogenase